MAARKAKGKKPQGRKVRKLRHWKQQFDANSAFVARKRLNLSAGTFEPGDVLPQEVLDDLGRVKLKRFWQSNRVELAEFDATQEVGVGTPTIKIDQPDQGEEGDEIAVQNAAKQVQLENLTKARKAAALKRQKEQGDDS